MTVVRPTFMAHGYPENTYKYEARVIQGRVDTRKARGLPCTSDMVWLWIKHRHPQWHELDHEQVYQRIRM